MIPAALPSSPWHPTVNLLNSCYAHQACQLWFCRTGARLHFGQDGIGGHQCLADMDLSRGPALVMNCSHIIPRSLLRCRRSAMWGAVWGGAYTCTQASRLCRPGLVDHLLQERCREYVHKMRCRSKESEGTGGRGRTLTSLAMTKDAGSSGISAAYPSTAGMGVRTVVREALAPPARTEDTPQSHRHTRARLLGSRTAPFQRSYHSFSSCCGCPAGTLEGGPHDLMDHLPPRPALCPHCVHVRALMHSLCCRGGTREAALCTGRRRCAQGVLSRARWRAARATGQQVVSCLCSL